MSLSIGKLQLVPTLCVGIPSATLRVVLPCPEEGRRASRTAFPRGAWERGVRGSLARCLYLLMALTCMTVFSSPTSAAEPDTTAVFIGTYTGGDSKGIYRFDLNTASGAVTAPKLAAEVPSPSFLAIDPKKSFLYAVSEINDFQGKKGGAVSGFSIDPKTGALAPINAESVGGAGPCHLTVDKAGKNVLVANYGGGSVAVLPIEANGRLKPLSSFVQHTGSSVDKGRQSEPHAHSVNVDAANKYAFVADLGLDKILIYKLDAEHGKLTPNDPPFAALALGSGPRHFAFRPNSKNAYVINELNSTITAFDYDPSRGALSTIQTISSIPEGSKAANYPAEVVVHPSGRFVYGSNRGQDNIAAFRVDSASGKLTLVGHQGAGIKNPRNFAIEPTGKFLLVANQDLGTVVVFRINQGSGALDTTGQTVKVPKAVCVRFWVP